MGKSGIKRGNAARDEEADAASALNGDVLALLHGPEGWEQLLKQSWGRHAVFCKSTPARKAVFTTCLSTAEQVAELARQQPLQYGLDIAVASCIEKEGEVLDPKTLKAVLSEPGEEVQVYEPQRYHDGLWQLVAKLEAALACLVGCTAHLLAADNPQEQYVEEAETWVCQTRGSRHWKQSAPEEPLEEEEDEDAGAKKEAKTSPALLDVTLQAGDVLYIPRGMEFEHDGPEASSFLVLTSHHEWTWADLVKHMLKAGSAEANPARLPTQLTASLPPAFLDDLGLVASMASDAEPGASKADAGQDQFSVHEQHASKSLAAGLRALADAIEAQPDELLMPAMDSMAERFVRRRLPPHPSQLQPPGPEPTMEDSLVVRGQGLFMIVPVDGPADEEEPAGFVVVTTPLFNNRLAHMAEEDENEDDDSDSLLAEDSEEEEEQKEEEETDKAAKAQNGAKVVKSEAGNALKEAGEGKADKSCCDKPGHHHHHHHHHHEHGSEDMGSDDIGDSDDDSDSDDEDEVGLPGPVVPATYAVAIAKVLSATAAPGIAVKDLVALLPHKDEQEALNLVNMLWSEGFASTIPGKPEPVAPKAAGKAAGKDKGAAKKDEKPAPPAKEEKAQGPAAKKQKKK